MKRLCLLLLMGTVPMLWGAANPFTGRWDLVVTPKTGSSYPDWLELVDRDGKAMLRIQPRSGGAKEIADFKVEGAHLHLVFSKADAKSPEVTWDLDAAGDKITGTISRAGSPSATVAGVPAPK